MARMITNTDRLLVVSNGTPKPKRSYEFVGHRSSKKTWGVVVPSCYYCRNDPHMTDKQERNCTQIYPREVKA